MSVLSRRSFSLGALSAATAATVPASSFAQCATIDLRIQNIPQETPVWCWVAVAQQIIYWLRGSAPAQCALVAIANNAPPGFCCSGNPACVTTGQLPQIQYLIQQFGGRPTQIARPAGPEAVYNTLAARRPIIMEIGQNNQFGVPSGITHVVVIRGMGCSPQGPFVIVNDPFGFGYFSQPILLAQLMPLWRTAIVVA